MEVKRHFGNIIDGLKDEGDHQIKERRKTYIVYVLTFLERLMEPMRSGYFENHLLWASCLPAMIPAFDFKTDFAYNEVSPLVYVGPQKKEHSPSRLPFDFDQSHTILSGSNSRLWIWNDEASVDIGPHKKIVLAYKQFGSDKKISYCSKSMKNIPNRITERHMHDFFMDLEKKILITKEYYKLTNQK